MLPIPPASLRAGMGPFDDPAVFLHSGRDTLELAKHRIGLEPTHRVLDVGCGCGRVALPMIEFLAPEGRYSGLDVDEACIDWCVRNIQARDARFEFTHMDARSESYNPGGALSSERITFPHSEASFDRALLSSVFTHMTESGMDRYLAELSRVISPEGRVLVSLLLMNDTTVAAIESRTTLFSFVDSLGRHSWTLDPARPLDAVGVSEAWIMDTASSHGFAVESVSYGTWRDMRSWKVEHDWLCLRRIGSSGGMTEA